MKREPSPPRQGRIEPSADWSRPGEPIAARIVPPPPVRWSAMRRGAWPWVVLAVLLLALMVGLAALREPVAERLWPGTRIQALLQEGELALSRGALTAADGSGARQRFEAAHALDEDRGEARAGLARVGQAALGQARAALAANDLDGAREALALARELQVPRPQSDPVGEEIRAREASRAGIDRLMQQALAAQAAGRLDDVAAGASTDAPGNDAGVRGALSLFQQVLALEPGHTAALEGREDALAEWLQQARGALAHGDLATGAAMIERASGFDPGHIDLPDSQAQLARSLDERLQQAARELQRGRLQAAAGGYAAVAAASPGHVEAAQGREQVAAAYAGQAARMARDYDFVQAELALAQARTLAPGAQAVGDAERALAGARQSRARLGSSVPMAQRQQRVQVLLQEMVAAEARGNWILPPGDSAFDKLRAAQALLPEHVAVRRAAARLLPATRECFEDELRANRIARARGCYDAWRALAPGSPALADARTRLAQKWVAVGTEQLGAGEVAFAQRALAEARALDAAAPGLDEFQQRVRTAGSAARP